MNYNNCRIVQIESVKKFSIPVCLIINKNINYIGRHVGDRTKIVLSLKKNNTKIFNEGFLLYFTQDNVAHSICQFIKSFYEYSNLKQKLTIYVSEVINRMPFLKKLFHLLFNTDDYVVLNINNYYNFQNLYIPEYVWFTNEINYSMIYFVCF